MPEVSAIKSVSHYVASPVTSCDRCAAGIKYVFVVTYKDGETQKYGSECINKILNNAPSLKTLFQANAKKLVKYQEYLTILSGPVEQMPVGSEYYNSGKYFIADFKGKDISFGHWFFHPVMNVEKNHAGKNYITKDPNEFSAQMLKAISLDIPKLTAEITRLELFLAKILRSNKNISS